jgi:hypothetical protein
MIAAIIVIWWIVLLLALALTVLAVLQILRIVEEALAIRRLAQRALPGARGIAAHTAAIGELSHLAAPMGRLVQAAQTIERTAAAIEGRAAAVARGLQGRSS